jgi:alkylation response protein AidB-like acyl-CoA dehydrogenase
MFVEAKEFKMTYENFLINTYFDSLDSDRFNSFREFEANETTRAIIQKYLEVNSEYPASSLEEKGTVPADLLKKLGRNDFFGLTIPRKYGGVGLKFLRWPTSQSV